MDKKIIQKINTLQVADINFPLKDAFVESVNNLGIKSITVYCIVEDTDTQRESKIKITISGDKEFIFDDVSDEEWNEHCIK